MKTQPASEAGSGKRTKRRLTRAERKEELAFYALTGPWLIGLAVFFAVPMAVSLGISLTRWDMLTPAEFVGLRNYTQAFTGDPLFWQSLKVTTLYALFSVPLGLVFSLLLSLLLNQAVRGMRLFRTIFYLPSVVSGVSVMVLWMWIFNPQIGLINMVLGAFGIEGPGWIFDPDWALPSMVIMSLWSSVGGSVIIWLAGLKGIPSTLYEAAELDGAGPLQKFWCVTVPMLTPTIFFNLVMGIIGAMQAFGEAYVMTKGGPMNSTLFFNFYLFDHAFQNFRMGYASALAWVLFVLILGLTALVVRSSAAWVYYEGERS
ncbi:carbohydrate ABC transporter permease [Paenibacillus pasadenensis]|uniref:carbohydrate ABC transporter permease n=1 Tax=Paenibacillus TaxID=44249 RepID=UPI00041A4B18|nr:MULTISPECIES: sugar ABC transporter permease [Paenibacillus]QGG56738.1 ABC transporter permease subunit [Paenibacillus sp. B01]